MNVIPAGTRFGRWTVVRTADMPGKSGIYYICRCDCGTVRNVRSSELFRGKTRSCGCLHADRMRAMRGTEKMKLQMAKARAAQKGNPMRCKHPDRPYKPKNIEQFGMDEWMFRN